MVALMGMYVPILRSCNCSIYCYNITSFSRKMLWLKLSSSNRDPRVIARYYLESIENVAGSLTKYNYASV